MDRELVTYLVKIYHSNYNRDTIKEVLHLKKMDALCTLALDLGERILKANASLTKANFEKTQKNFISLVDHLKAKGSVQLVTFAAQLLQYYTILASDDFSSSFHFRQFQRFLINHHYEFGEINRNLFLIEYQLIKIFNDLVQYDSSYIATKPRLLKSHTSNYLKLIEKSLVTLKEDVENFQKEAINNMFVHYLLFLMNYTMAALCYSQLKEKSKAKGLVLQLSTQQKKYLGAAKKEIEILRKDQDKRSAGLEYGLGETILFHFPEKNLDKLSKELSLLAA